MTALELKSQSYSIQLPSQNAQLDCFYLGKGHEGECHNTVFLDIVPLNRKRWTGRFQQGSWGASYSLETANSEIACIIIKGQGYWVPVNLPQGCSLIPVAPIKGALVSPELKMTVFWDYTHICVFDEKNLIWVSKRISWDGFQGIHFQKEFLVGQAWHSPKNTWTDFRIKLSNGR